jgi:hypothetical protein
VRSVQKSLHELEGRYQVGIDLKNNVRSYRPLLVRRAAKVKYTLQTKYLLLSMLKANRCSNSCYLGPE